MAYGARDIQRRGSPERRRRVARAKELRGQGRSWEEIGRELGVHATTAFYYVYPRVVSGKGDGREDYVGLKGACDKCGTEGHQLTRWKRQRLCPDCLNAEDEPATVEEAATARHNERIFGW